MPKSEKARQCRAARRAAARAEVDSPEEGETLSEVVEEDDSDDQCRANAGNESNTPTGRARQSKWTIRRLANSCAASCDDPEVVLKKYHNMEDAETDHETQGTSERAQCILLTFSNESTGETITVSQGWGRDLVASYAAQALTEPNVDLTLPHSELALLTEGRAYVFVADRSKREGVDREGAKKAARALTGMVCWRSNDWFCSARPVPVTAANEALNTVLKRSKVQGARLSRVVGGIQVSDYSLLSANPEPRAHGRIVPSTPLPVLAKERDHRGREDAGSTQWEDPTNHWAALEASLDNKGSSDLRLMVEQLRRTTSEDERVSGNSRYGVKPTLPKFNAKADSDSFITYDCWKNRVLELLGMGYSPAVVKLQMFQSLSGLPSEIISNLQAGANVFDMISALDDAFLNLTSLESIKREFYQSRMRQGESVTDFWTRLGSCLG